MKHQWLDDGRGERREGKEEHVRIPIQIGCINERNLINHRWWVKVLSMFRFVSNNIELGLLKFPCF
jgi:hypothetical protein